MVTGCYRDQSSTKTLIIILILERNKDKRLKKHKNTRAFGSQNAEEQRRKTVQCRNNRIGRCCVAYGTEAIGKIKHCFAPFAFSCRVCPILLSHRHIILNALFAPLLRRAEFRAHFQQIERELSVAPRIGYCGLREFFTVARSTNG